jgi:hypothetical protein
MIWMSYMGARSASRLASNDLKEIAYRAICSKIHLPSLSLVISKGEKSNAQCTA